MFFIGETNNRDRIKLMEKMGDSAKRFCENFRALLKEEQVEEIRYSVDGLTISIIGKDKDHIFMAKDRGECNRVIRYLNR